MTEFRRETHVDAEKARAGETSHVVRWVLGISLTLAVIAMSAVWLIPTLTNDRTIDEVPVDTTGG
ncbi:hypothetical protein [Alteraurantiacibacter buctensis]|uniref:Uncharacterized protein n=1 Tax=Alteraurantiacibacter buctensis TaxID=1503981 RepID=A0A844Z1H3_9SPHN|nr:hypothetical protein [Alteraurantiacibacter buctensis]MXO73096.1 hypothetical protein [Alteraurantiacibacter buctensis]